MSIATKYHSAFPPLSDAALLRCIHESPFPAKSGFTPSFANASAGLHSITPRDHTSAASFRTVASAAGYPRRPGERVGLLRPQIFAPWARSSPMRRTIRSLIVSVSGSMRSEYSTPPGATTFPSLTVSISTAFVAQTSQEYPAGIGTGMPLPFGTSSPVQ